MKLNELVLLCSTHTGIPPSEFWRMDVVQFFQMSMLLEKQAKERAAALKK